MNDLLLHTFSHLMNFLHPFGGFGIFHLSFYIKSTPSEFCCTVKSFLIKETRFSRPLLPKCNIKSKNTWKKTDLTFFSIDCINVKSWAFYAAQKYMFVFGNLQNWGDSTNLLSRFFVVEKPFLWLCVSICHFMVKLVHCTCIFHLSNINCDVIIPFSSIYTRAAHTYTPCLSTLNWPTSQYGWNIMYPFCVLRYLNCNFFLILAFGQLYH